MSLTAQDTQMMTWREINAEAAHANDDAFMLDGRSGDVMDLLLAIDARGIERVSDQLFMLAREIKQHREQHDGSDAELRLQRQRQIDAAAFRNLLRRREVFKSIIVALEHGDTNQRAEAAGYLHSVLKGNGIDVTG